MVHTVLIDYFPKTTDYFHLQFLWFMFSMRI